MGDTFPKPGGVFENRYRIESVIGRGGFAQIYLAEQIDLGRQVALKVLSPSLRGADDHGQEVAERFRREAKLVATLRDPHTITMYDYGRTDDGLLYMVFEYIDGVTLSGLVRREGRISAERATKILGQCLSSLQEAHALGVLHRDIKPANIMVYEHIGRTDQVKVLDFGIAKSVLGDDQSAAGDLTQTGMIIGTPRYMAPEQLRGTPLGPQTDLYSLGLVAYELLTGHKAIELDSMVSIITRQVSDEPIQLPENLGLSARFRAIINAMLHKLEKQRFQNAGEVISALDGLSQEDLASAVNRQTSEPTKPPALPSPTTLSSHTPTGAIPAQPPPITPRDADSPADEPTYPTNGFSTSGTIPAPVGAKKKSGGALLIVAVLIVLGGAGLTYLFGGTESSPEHTTLENPTALTDQVQRPEKKKPDSPVNAPTNRADRPDRAPNKPTEVARHKTAAAIELGEVASASERVAGAADAERPDKPNTPAAEDKVTGQAKPRKKTQKPAHKPKRSGHGEKTRSRPTPKKSTPKESESKESAPKKDDSSSSSFPALDGI